MTLSDDRVSGDVLHDELHDGSFADKNVGTAKTVSVSGISITGTDAGNYTFNTTASTTADITREALTVDGHGREQGLRRHDGGDRDAVSDNRVSRRCVDDSYTRQRSRTRTSGTARR